MNDELTPLGEVIDAAQRDLGWSNRELERQSDGIAGLGKSNIGSLKRKPQASVKASTIKNLSKLLRIPEARIAQAVLDTMGINRVIEKPASLREAVDQDVDLSSKDKRIVRAVLKAVKEEGDGSADNSTSLTHAGVSPADEDGYGTFGGRARGDLDHDSQNDGAGDNVHPLRPDLDSMAAYDTGKETEKERLLREEAEREQESQDPDDWE